MHPGLDNVLFLVNVVIDPSFIGTSHTFISKNVIISDDLCNKSKN